MEKDQIAQRMRDHLARSAKDNAKDPLRMRIERETTFAGVLKLWPESDEAFVRGLIRLLLGREADAAGLEYGLGLLGRGTRLQTVRSLATCEEARVRGLDASWLPQIERLHPDGPRAWQVFRRGARGLVRMSAKAGAMVLRRLWQWSGNPLRDPIAELVAHARRVEAAGALAKEPGPGQACSTQPDAQESLEERRWREVSSQLGELRSTYAGLLAAIESGGTGAAAMLKRSQGAAPGCSSACHVCGRALGGDGAAS
jgi:hypothetical protein